MADVVFAKKPKTDVMALAALLGASGVALIAWSLTQRKPIADAPNPLGAGEKLDGLASLSLDQDFTIEVPAAGTGLIIVGAPHVRYTGPGRDCYTYAQIKQYQHGQWVTVYGSGIAGIHLPEGTGQQFNLVPPTQTQPEGCPQLSLCCQKWPGTQENPICGAPPARGLASVLLEVYEKRYPVDADGFSSPTCNPTRRPVARRVYSDKVLFR